MEAKQETMTVRDLVRFVSRGREAMANARNRTDRIGSGAKQIRERLIVKYKRTTELMAELARLGGETVDHAHERAVALQNIVPVPSSAGDGLRRQVHAMFQRERNSP